MNDYYLQWIVKALADLLKFGVPITFSADTSNSLVFIRSKRGFVTLRLTPLLDPLNKDVKSIGVAEVSSPYYIPLGFVRRDSEGDIVSVDYTSLLRVLAGRVLTVFEADLWTLRLANRFKLSTPSDIPKWLVYVNEKGLKVMELSETCDYAIGIEDVIGVWVNVCTGRVDMALEEQEKMNLMKWGSLKDVLVGWVKQLESL